MTGPGAWMVRPAAAALFAVVFMLVLAPLMTAAPTAPANAVQFDMAQAGDHAPCDDAAMQGHAAPDKLAGECLAACLAVQGMVLPELAEFAASYMLATVRIEPIPARTLSGRSSGIDPPPPRLS